MRTGLLRIFLWNIESGGAGRSDRIAASVKAHAPDIIVLNEYRAGTSNVLISELQAAGWKEFIHSNPPSGFGGVAVLSREKLKHSDQTTGLDSHAYRCLRVEIESAALLLYAVYAPYKEGCREFWEPLIDELKSKIDSDTVVLGDFNAGASGDVPEHPRLAGSAYIHQVLDTGYRDLWASCRNAREPVEHTWYGGANPYRIDHAFGSPGASSRVRSYSYDHECRKRKESDHSSLTVEFTPKPVARAGSRKWLQIAVNLHPEVLDRQILDTLNAADVGQQVEWLSPLEGERYVEYRDGATIERLGVKINPTALAEFWPTGGPVWDGLARLGEELFLVEAKAHVPEMLSPGTRATGDARTQILEALKKVRGALVPKSEVEWNGAFYQYANRIAHLHFLREHGVKAHLVYVYFLNAPDVDGPTTREEWEGAIILMESVLGVRRTRLSRYIHKVFVDVRDLDTSNAISTES